MLEWEGLKTCADFESINRENVEFLDSLHFLSEKNLLGSDILHLRNADQKKGNDNYLGTNLGVQKTPIVGLRHLTMLTQTVSYGFTARKAEGSDGPMVLVVHLQ